MCFSCLHKKVHLLDQKNTKYDLRICTILYMKRELIMKYLFQFTIIGMITAIGELLNLLLPLPIPASIYGLVILFIALCTKIIRLDQVEHAADFFLAIMPILFVPSTVNLMNYWGVLKDNVVGLLVTCILSTMAVMGITGSITQLIMKIQRSKNQDIHGISPDISGPSGQDAAEPQKEGCHHE